MEKLRYNFGGTSKEIVDIVVDYKDKIAPSVRERNEYAKGNNQAILKRQLPPNSPQNKIIVPYARRMIKIVTSYMYTAGSVQYASDNQSYLDALMEIFDYNEEPLQTAEMGRQVSIQGVGYELFFNEALEYDKLPNGTLAPTRIMPRFTRMPVDEIIPIYSYDIEPQLTHFIRYYKQDDPQVWYIHVYDATTRYMYEWQDEGKTLVPTGEELHGFNQPPLIVYENNEDRQGDFDSVQTLIDAHDVLMSDSMNEFDRFAQAYLVLKGFAMRREDLENVKHQRVFSLLNEKDAVEFLTKEIQHEFIKFEAEWQRAEIHKHSGIPNLDDINFGANASGETLSKWIYLMDLFTTPKESYFKRALADRIGLITEYSGLPGDPTEIKITMNRNVPDKSMEQAEIMEKYSGHVSEETLLENFADFVDNVEEERERLKAEKEANMEMMDLDNIGMNDNDGDDNVQDGDNE